MSAQATLDFLVSADMSEREQLVWSALRGHEGAPRAIKAETLAELTRLSVRNVQRAIHALIHEHGKPVGSSMQEPFGYFVAITSGERQAAAKLHTDRALAMLTTASRIRAIDRRELLRELQTELADV